MKVGWLGVQMSRGWMERVGGWNGRSWWGGEATSAVEGNIPLTPCGWNWGRTCLTPHKRGNLRNWWKSCSWISISCFYFCPLLGISVLFNTDSDRMIRLLFFNKFIHSFIWLLIPHLRLVERPFTQPLTYPLIHSLTRLLMISGQVTGKN